MLDEAHGMAEETRDQHFAFWQLDALPDAPLVLMARVGHLERIRTGVDLQHRSTKSLIGASWIRGRG